MKKIRADSSKPSPKKKPVATKSVSWADAHTPITVHDQYGNPYVCLNWYEASRLHDMLIRMQAQGIREYDTGDWWLDLPLKLTKWLTQQNDTDAKANKRVRKNALPTKENKTNEE